MGEIPENVFGLVPGSFIKKSTTSPIFSTI